MDLIDTKDFCQRPCPQCSRTESRVTVSASSPADQQELNNLTQAWFGFFKTPVFFDFHRCSHCGLLYNKRFFSPETLEKLYSQLPDNTAGQDIYNLRKTQQGYYRFLEKEAEVRGNYLELGPDIGLFTEFVSRTPVVEKLFLFEPNEAVYPELERAAGSKPYHIFSGLFDFSEVADNSIQTAVAIHVLDHLLNPQQFIKELFKKLAPGGTLLIVTHNERSLLARVLKRRWPAHCLQHPQLFNFQSTKSFLENCGFRQVKTKRSINYFTLSYLFKHLAWALGFQKIKMPRILNFALPLPLGNIMTVAKRPSEN